MGACFSKKKEPSSAPSNPIPKEPTIEKKAEKKRREATTTSRQVAAEATAEKKQVFVITQSSKRTPLAAAAEEEKERRKGEIDPKKASHDGEIGSGGEKPATVRTSSCTKEEVDAILIQCGRLSRSSSGKASNETGGNHRKYSGSKRSYDFDNEKRREDEEDWEKPVSRPSPHRRTPSRERSGSRERGSGGNRRVSRSPGRRSDDPISFLGSATGDKPKQPTKLVSVPAREKGGAAAETGKRVSSSVVNNKRNASPRSRSPANTTRVSNENAHCQPQSLSRSSSKKAEQSPYRRNPMAEIDDNSLKGNQNKMPKSKEGEEGMRKPSTQMQTQNASDQRNGGALEISNGIKISSNNNNAISSCVREQLLSCRAKEQQPEPETVEDAKEVKGASSKGIEVENLNPRTITRSRSSRRSSRDFDQSLGLNPDAPLNPTSYTSLLLEDIQIYHQQNGAFSLPACVSKACSILEAVADLNSSSSENKSYDGDKSSNNENNGLPNGRFGRRGLAPREPFVESEIVVKDDLMEPSLHKYISVRDLGGETEPQESAGSNSFVGQPWPSSWEPNSVDSTDRYWTSHSNHGEEVEEDGHSPLGHHQQNQQTPLPEAARRRSRGGGSSSNSLPGAMASNGKKRDFEHRQLRSSIGGGNGKVGGRGFPIHVPAATS